MLSRRTLIAQLPVATLVGAAAARALAADKEVTIGIDLPLKALVWQDESRTTWLSYNDPSFLAQRHGLGERAKGPVAAMTAALNAIAAKETRP